MEIGRSASFDGHLLMMPAQDETCACAGRDLNAGQITPKYFWRAAGQNGQLDSVAGRGRGRMTNDGKDEVRSKK